MSLPDPLVPADVDLRAYDWFPLKHKQLRRSTWWLRASDRAKAISVELWCASYEEVPAGSLPDDDMALSDAVGFGRRDLSQWLAVKDEVMSAWTLCSDGRWYHPTMADVANEAWQVRADKRERERLKKQAQRARGGGGGGSSPGTDGDALPSDAEPKKPKKGGGGAAVPRDIDTQHTTGQNSTGDKRSGKADGVGAAPLAPAHPRGTRLPLDWILSDEDQAYALEKGIPADDVDNLAEEFFTYWRGAAGQKGTKLDWPATWRNHVLKQIRWRKERGNGPGSGTDRGRAQHQDRVGALLEGALEAVGRVQGRRGPRQP